MATTGGDVLVQVLQQWGVEYVFGLPGDGINGIMEALRLQCDKIKFVQVRHEEAAAFMAWPPMPPEIEGKQALKFAESLARGEPNRMKIATTILGDKVKELV